MHAFVHHHLFLTVFVCIVIGVALGWGIKRLFNRAVNQLGEDGQIP